MSDFTSITTRPFGLGLPPRKAFGAVPAIALLLSASLLSALETPSKPFLDKNSFLSVRPPDSGSRSPTTPRARRRCTRCRRTAS